MIIGGEFFVVHVYMVLGILLYHELCVIKIDLFNNCEAFIFNWSGGRGVVLLREGVIW